MRSSLRLLCGAGLSASLLLLVSCNKAPQQPQPEVTQVIACDYNFFTENPADDCTQVQGYYLNPGTGHLMLREPNGIVHTVHESYQAPELDIDIDFGSVMVLPRPVRVPRSLPAPSALPAPKPIIQRNNPTRTAVPAPVTSPAARPTAPAPAPKVKAPVAAPRVVAPPAPVQSNQRTLSRPSSSSVSPLRSAPSGRSASRRSPSRRR